MLTDVLCVLDETDKVVLPIVTSGGRMGGCKIHIIPTPSGGYLEFSLLIRLCWVNPNGISASSRHCVIRIPWVTYIWWLPIIREVFQCHSLSTAALSHVGFKRVNQGLSCYKSIDPRITLATNPLIKLDLQRDFLGIFHCRAWFFFGYYP